MPFLLKNGPNSNKVGKGHILPLNNVHVSCALQSLIQYAN